MPRRAWAYICTVLLVGTVLTALALPGLSLASGLWLEFVTLIVLATLAQLFKAEAPNHVLLYATPIFLFAGVLLLPPFLIVVLIAVPHLVEWGKERLVRSTYLRAWYLQPFNIAMNSIAGLCGHWIFTTLIRILTKGHTSPGILVGHTLSDMLVVTLTAFTYLAVNHFILGQVLVLARGVSWRESGVLDTESLLNDLILLCLGAVVAMLWGVNNWMIVWALSPLVLMYQALMIPQLKQQAQTDGKTGLCNARHFNTLFTAELDRARRFGRPLAVIMADLDLLREINNTYGHLAGDTVLAGIGKIIRSTIRDYDVAARFGGEEFAIVLPETEPGEALALAERLRAAIEETRFEITTNPTPIKATMSLGVACFPEDATTPTDLTHAADIAVYHAKSSGRNCVVCTADVPHFSRLEHGRLDERPLSTSAVVDVSAPPLLGGGTPGAMGVPVKPDMHDEATPVERRKATPDEHVETTLAAHGEAAPVPGESNASPWALWLFVSGVIAAGVGATILGSIVAPLPPLALVAVLTAMAALAELLQVDLYGRGTVSVSVGLAFGAALITGATGLACVSAAIALAHHLRQRRQLSDLHRTAFNWATHMLAGLAPVLAISVQHIPLHVSNLLYLAPWAALAALIYYIIETGLIATALSLAEGTRLQTTWQAQYRWLAGHYLVLCLMGLVLGIAYAALDLPGVLVFTLPVVMMHYVQKQYIVRTKESVRELKRLNQELTRAALTDSLTGLGNHRAFQDEVHREIARAVRHAEPVVLVRIDLDELRAINEQHGQGHGDRLLITLAAVLPGRRTTDRAFRFRSDEFALILPHTSLKDAVTVMDRLRQDAQESLCGATISVGIAALMPGDYDADLLLEQAGAALAEAKRLGRNAIVTFEEIRDSASIVSPAQAQAVRRLLAEREVSVAFQPIWDLQRGHILAFEALTRLAATSGLSGPQEAFDVAERIGRAHDLDAVCREAVLARARELPPDVLLFLNVSPQTLDHDLLAGTALVEAVMAAGLTPDRVVLELTERSVARPQIVVREAKRLRALGFRLALDDTGTGNAGLEVLSQLPVDFVKIDRSVVANALTDKTARGVLAGIIAIARETDTYVIAEGIETTEMLDLVRWVGMSGPLAQRGVQGVQGYLLGRPSETIPDVTSLEEQSALVQAA